MTLHKKRYKLSKELRLKLALSAFICSFGFHFFFISTLHLKPIKPLPRRDSLLSKTQAEYSYEKLLREKRSLELGKIFANLQKQQEIDSQTTFQELTFEFAPPALLSFPEGEPMVLKEEKFSLNPSELTIQTIDKDGVALQGGSSLISSTPHHIENPPPMAEGLTLNPKEQIPVIGGDAFDVQIEYTHKKERPGYVFKLTLTPKSELHFQKLKQNYHFLIDRSNSIPRGRFVLNKKIVAAALHHLRPGDQFNVLLFDDRVVRLSKEPLAWNQETLVAALEFLDKQQHGGYFAATDLYSSLDKVLPPQVSDEEMHTAILLSDGDTYLPLEKQRQTIGKWTFENGGKISLFTATTGKGNNLSLLELISIFNKGSLIYSLDPKAMEERFVQHIKMIRTPIGKNISLHTLSKDDQMSLRLQPKPHHLPHLYRDMPYVIYGSTNRLSDFVLFLQGTVNGQAIDLKKHISFKEAKSSSPELEKRWVQMIAFDHYYNFLQEGNPKHLDIAKRLLQTHKLPLPLTEDAHYRR